ncbi:MAG TPA: DUF3108 domain-containing protein, partial [Nitrospirota bacterium]
MTVALFVLAFGLAAAPAAKDAKEKKAAPLLPKIAAFLPGESLTYDISWSDAVRAGTAVMEVRPEQLAGGRQVLRLVVTSRTVGIVDKLYPLGDTVESVFDPDILESLSYDLEERHRGRTRRLTLAFDHESNTVLRRRNEDPPQTLEIPDPVQDPLSALYYLRTRQSLTVGESVSFNVFGGSESAPVEVLILGRERVETPAGEFSAIKLKAYKGL